MQQVLANGNKRKQYVQKMFNDIAHRYDLLNHLLSGGTDIYWRRKAISKLNISPDSLVLDIACGTGDFAFTTQKLKKSNVIGLDIATKMLSLGKQKAIDKKKSDKIHFLAGDGENIPFADKSFDAVTVAFGVRNMGDVKKNLNEMSRVIKPGGELIILEFSTPKLKIIKKLYRVYFHKILPGIGKLISKDKEAYTYLPVSVDYFPVRREFARWIEDEDFYPVNFWRLFNGIAVIYKGIKK
ncbi:MAG: bifunctional demethylmenaquinone methyltransferase/2-methoxy-6-polyprenyl-1,4-benzoquinol methylase UbiE [Calditrichia bacterium]|nr:bifunctional demethylmenaquinone methyltransferase/2-methoxy-6-polyprenyl-1,4-benzoquinol methylase UbiE [Calditrichia bacterium]